MRVHISYEALLSCAVAIALLLSACVPSEEDNDRIPNFDPEDNIMGQIQEEGVLKIGIDKGAAPWSSVPKTGENVSGAPSGFTVELGQLVADSLGVDAQFVAPQDPATLPGMVDNGEVDIAFPLVPITEDLLVEHGLTDPYWVAHQRLLVPEDSAIDGIDDLAGDSVCSIANEETSVDLELLNPAIADIVLATDEHECLRLIRNGAVAAVTGPDILLLTIEAADDDLAIVGDQLSTEGYGAFVSRGTGGFDGYVDGIFAEADKELDWTKLYGKWITPITGEDPPPFPTMNLEEAAALFPADG
jgi:ABC-type amino acid transport substrate-binding protein